MCGYDIELPHVAVSTEFITRGYGAYHDIVYGAIVGETPTDDILLCAGRAFRLLSSKLGVSLKEEEDGEEITFTDFTLADEPAERDTYETDEDFPITAGCYDAFSGDIFLREGYSLLRLRSDGSVEPLAGLRATPGRAEGKGLSARFETLGGVASDGVGSLYVEDDKRIRRVQLPAEWRRGAPRDHGSGSAAPAVTVSTLHTSADGVNALAYDGTTDSLVFASDAKLFRLPLRRAAAAAANGAAGVGAGAGPVANGAAGGRAGGRSRNSSGGGRSGAAGAVTRLEPQLIAGGGHSSSGAAPKDFEDPVSIAVDGDGNIFVLDRAADEEDDESINCCIKAIRGGGGSAAAAAASTSAGAGPGAAAPARAEEEAGGLFDQLDEDGVLVGRIPVDTYMVSACMTVLRNGSLMVACPNGLVALWLGLKPTLLRPRVSAPAAAPPRSLASDLGSLLESPPDATSDLTLRVGGRKFAVHRAILAARCDYFRQRLAADTFSDGAAAELELPDADADAFALLLRWLYTGTVELPAAAGQLQFIAELADRLLLPDLSAAATHKLLAAVTPATVVDAMLWAERQGEAGAALLALLKEWYLEHDEQVAATARDSLKRLAVASPDLMVELHVAKKKRPRAA